MALLRFAAIFSCLAAVPLACGNPSEGGGAGGGAAGTLVAGSAGALTAGSGGNAGTASGGEAAGGSSGSVGEAGAGGEAGVSSSCPFGSAPVTRLSVSNEQILAPSATPIKLRGWNWGQWGSEQPKDAEDNAAQGATIVRIPLRWWGFYDNEDSSADPITRVDSRSDDSPGHIEPHHLHVLDQMIHDAACQGLWIDLFLDSNCGQASVTGDTAAYCGTVAGGAAANFANDPQTTEKFAQVWEFLVARYQDQPFIGMYELLPEPHLGCTSTPCVHWDAAPNFYKPLIQRVRAIDVSTPIIVGPDGGYEIKQIATAFIPGVPGLIYTGDFLDGASGHPEYVKYATDFRTQNHAPVFIQQLGSRKDDPDPNTRATTILEAMNAADLGWAWWTYRETKSATGNGFAPYWEASAPPWQEDASWLKLITDQFR